MNRKPIYPDEQDKNVRIISVANSLWQKQRLGTTKGTNTFDPWINVGQPYRKS